MFTLVADLLLRRPAHLQTPELLVFVNVANYPTFVNLRRDSTSMDLALPWSQARDARISGVNRERNARERKVEIGRPTNANTASRHQVQADGVRQREVLIGIPANDPGGLLLVENSNRGDL
jgi:hypothetical protein